MNLSAAGAAFVRHHEGFVPRYYLDPVGVGTIGIGFTWRSDAFRDWWSRNRPGQAFGPGATMTRAEAEDALVYLMREEYGAAVARAFGTVLRQHEFDGASSVVFNAGAATLDDRWAQAAKRGDWRAAAELLKTTRVTAKGKRLAGLVSRRLDEAELIELGDYTIGRPRGTQLDPMEDGILVRGERGEAVRKLQADLQAADFYGDGVVDGIFGPGTEAAVMEFQRSVGLADDGYAGPLTLAALEKVRAPAPVPIPTPRPEPTSTPEPAMTDKTLTPIEQMNKPVQGAKAGFATTTLSGALLYLWSTTGAFPETWRDDPQAVIALTLVAASLPGLLAYFVAAYRARDKRFQAAG